MELLPTGHGLTFKIVYSGPGRAGKSESLEILGKRFRSKRVGEMVVTKDPGDRYWTLTLRTLCPAVSVQVMTVPGSTYYASTKQAVLKGVDGIVFAAVPDYDEGSGGFQPDHGNAEEKRLLEELLGRHGLNLKQIPWALQIRDLGWGKKFAVAETARQLGLPETGVPVYLANDREGINIIEPFLNVLERVVWCHPIEMLRFAPGLAGPLIVPDTEPPRPDSPRVR